jgi:hypothetical protein
MSSNRTYSQLERIFMFAVPTAWAILLMFHPRGDGDFFPIVTDNVFRWELVHLGTMVFVPAMAGVVFLLLRGCSGPAARVSRICALAFAVFYTAWEVLVGVGTGLMVNEVNSLSGEAARTGAELVESYNHSSILLSLLAIGGLGLSVSLIGAGYALKKEVGASNWVFGLLVLSTLPIGFHEPPFGPIGLALFIAAVYLATRQRDLRTSAVSALTNPA